MFQHISGVSCDGLFPVLVGFDTFISRRFHHSSPPPQSNRCQVTRRLRGPLDDDRRAVRQAAVEARNIWFLLG